MDELASCEPIIFDPMSSCGESASQSSGYSILESAIYELPERSEAITMHWLLLQVTPDDLVTASLNSTHDGLAYWTGVYYYYND